MTHQRPVWLAQLLALLARRRPNGHDGPMIGAAIIVFILVIGIPVSVVMSGAVASGLLGWLVRADVESTHEGSELLDLNV